MGKVISIVNRKGGVGKTTLSIALCDAFVWERQIPVSLIDLDPQASASQVLLNDNEYTGMVSGHRNLNGLLNGRLFEGQRNGDIDQIRYAMRHPFNGNRPDIDFDLYPNNEEFWNLEAAQIQKDGAQQLVSDVGSIIQEISSKYPITIIDCPPGQSFSSLAALKNSDLILCPITPDRLAQWGMKLLQKYVEQHAGDKPLRFIMSRANERNRIAAQVTHEVRSEGNFLMTEQGAKNPNMIAEFPEANDVRKRMEENLKSTMRGIYGSKVETALRSITKAIEHELGV